MPFQSAGTSSEMVKLQYKLRFLTPAFLGNAQQQGQWRTPAIKASLRQWWRVAYASEKSHRVNEDEMRKAEGRLFGFAADKESLRSRLLLRLDSWANGTLVEWQPLPRVHHPEVGQGGMKVGSDLYLGYGPLQLRQGATQIKNGAAIQAGEAASLRIGVPESEVPVVTRALQLMQHYGTLGGRSRNGWGSFELLPECPGAEPGHQSAGDCFRDWREAFDRDWPHAIGRDTKGSGAHPLVWRSSQPLKDWHAAMVQLAEVKIALRRSFVFPDGEREPHRQTHLRHWLAYPVTHHSVREWGNNARLPNSLRFKIRRDSGDAEKVRAVIFHVPCRPPKMFRPDASMDAIREVWARAHAFLDQRTDLKRTPY
jgi:CRISPR-associated protein Cmr1